MTAIEVELEASASINWKQFLTMGFVDHTELKIIRRLVMCFWIPMFGEWMGVSLLAYFAPSQSTKRSYRAGMRQH